MPYNLALNKSIKTSLIYLRKDPITKLDKALFKLNNLLVLQNYLIYITILFRKYTHIFKSINFMFNYILPRADEKLDAVFVQVEGF